MEALLIKARYLSLGTQILLLKAGMRAAHASRIVLKAMSLYKAGTPKEKKNR